MPWHSKWHKIAKWKAFQMASTKNLPLEGSMPRNGGRQWLHVPVGPRHVIIPLRNVALPQVQVFTWWTKEELSLRTLQTDVAFFTRVDKCPASFVTRITNVEEVEATLTKPTSFDIARSLVARLHPRVFLIAPQTGLPDPSFQLWHYRHSCVAGQGFGQKFPVRTLRLEICQKIYTTQFSGVRILHTENA